MSKYRDCFNCVYDYLDPGDPDELCHDCELINPSDGSVGLPTSRLGALFRWGDSVGIGDNNMPETRSVDKPCPFWEAEDA